MSRRRLGFLAWLTGAAGLGSETLSLKLLGLTVGAASLVAFAVLASFLFGVGVGSYFSSRVRRPWIIEAALCVYNLALALFLDQFLSLNAQILAAWIPALGPNLAPAILGTLYIASPAFLLGVSFPAIAERTGDAAWAYGRQALGALVGVVVMELLGYPFLGVPGSLCAVAALHAVNAGLMWGPAFRLERQPLGELHPVLLAAGILTGAFQGSWLLLGCLVATPHWSVQPAVIATMILGLTLGTAWWQRTQAPFESVLGLASLGMSVSIGASLFLATLPPAGSIWSTAGQVIGAVAPAAIPIGALFPAYSVRLGASRARVGAALLSLSMGNVVGVLVSGGLLLRHLSAPESVGVAAFGAAVLSVALGRRRLGVAASSVAIASFALVIASGREAHFIARLHHGVKPKLEVVFRGGAEISAVYSAGSDRRLYQNGLSPIGLSESAESRIAFVGAAYAPKAERALVLGVGSGQTAGAVARAFRHTDVVDLGETVPQIATYLDAESFGLMRLDSVRFLAMDAVLAPAILDPGYDLIVLTVDPSFLATASKLYTKDYFERVQRLLAPDGVFTFWADATLDADAIQVLWNTAASVFPNQKRFHAHSGPSQRRDVGYHFVVSSAAALVFDRDRPAARTVAGLTDQTMRISVLLRQERAQLMPDARLSKTQSIHSFAHPSPAIVLGGFSRALPELPVRPVGE